MLGLSSTDIKVKVSSEKDCIQTISVEWPATKVKEQIEKAFAHVQGRVRIPGFRQGKAPMEVVKQNYKDAAYAQAQDDLLQEGVVEALKTKKLKF
jgi:trigger factor